MNYRSFTKEERYVLGETDCEGFLRASLISGSVFVEPFSFAREVDIHWSCLGHTISLF